MKNVIYTIAGSYAAVLGGVLLYKDIIGFIPAACIGFCGMVTLTDKYKTKKEEQSNELGEEL